MTKVQKKKEAERQAKKRQAELSSYDKPIIVVHSQALEVLLKGAPKAQPGA